MSQAVAEQKGKVPKRNASSIRKVRLWVRAKFNGFRRYGKHDLDHGLNKTSTNPSSLWKE